MRAQKHPGRSRGHYSRRQWFAAMGAGLATTAVAATHLGKPMRGAFMILATPYTTDKAIDYEDLAAEVKFLDRCGVQGMVWPQHASDLALLTHEERIRGMEVLAEAAKGTKPALVLGVQAENTAKMLEYAKLAEQLAPDARWPSRRPKPSRSTTTASTTPPFAA